MGKRIFHLVLFVFSVFFTILAFQLEFMTPQGRPGPGFLPIIVGIGLVALTGLSLWHIWANRNVPPKEQEKVFTKDMTVVIVLSCLLVLFLRTLGSIIATALFIFLVTIYFDRQKPVRNVLISLAVPILIYLLLQVWLNTGLPKGLLEWI